MLRKIYTNIYLFERNINPLQIQKHNRELELIIREQILNSIRDNIPVEDILKVYLDETIEDDVVVEEKEEIISTEPIEEEQKEPEEENVVNEENLPENEENSNINDSNAKSTIQFNDIDEAISIDKIISEIEAPKDEDRLEQISNDRNIARKLEESDDEGDDRLTIGEKISLTEMDVHDLEKPKIINKTPIGLDEIEILT